MARPTDDRKGNFIGLRINDETKERIQRLADEQGESFSECVRNILNVKHYDFVKQDNNVKRNDNVKQNEVQEANERIAELEADVKAKQERIAELEFQNDADYVEQLKKRIEELQTEIAGLRFLTPEYRDEVENMAEMTCGVERFYKSILDKIENREMDFNENGFDMTDTDVAEALKNDEVRKRLEDLRRGCDEKQESRTKAMTRALRVGLDKVRGQIWGIKN